MKITENETECKGRNATALRKVKKVKEKVETGI
jgi:hypothetical protein